MINVYRIPEMVQFNIIPSAEDSFKVAVMFEFEAYKIITPIYIF